MSAAPNPHLKSLPATPTGPRLAGPAPATSGSGAPKVVGRKAVPTAVRPAPQTGDGRYPIAWLTITAPRGAVPTVTSVCQCGRNLFAAGHHKALALIEDHTDHRTHCPLRIDQEGTAA
ncbi:MULTISPECIES: hypothetical protein [unclassified Streptomyces]|uniref:hypothetical protein n=1 Tax=unclassified Streptomyces TaxID=2593676 RepID=UPI000CD51F5B|nr:MULTISPECIES: hypothetical protein [unclassified Streptomyces]AWL39818.1 hypothetical protein B9S64_18325 [Streptomyces sp. SM18]